MGQLRDNRFVHRMLAFGDREPTRDERFRVVIDGPKVQIFDERGDLPVIEVTPIYVNTRRDWYPGGLNGDSIATTVISPRRGRRRRSRGT